MCKLGGSTDNISSNDITKGNKKSCGCLKRANIIGVKSNKLTVIKLLKNKKNKQRQWKCLCECGKLTTASTCQIQKSTKKSCGCSIRNDLAGNIYGFLEVLSYSHSTNNRAYWLCKCICGNFTKVSSSNLKNAQSKSCGCMTQQIRNKTNLLRYGVENTMWEPKMALKASRAQNNSHLLKHWKTGEEVVCVGSYEKRVIEYLNSNKINYKWQHKIFEMRLLSGKKTTYRPDLYLIGKKKPWVEIKGFFWDDAEEKWSLFHTEIKPNSQLWNKEKLKELEIL